MNRFKFLIFAMVCLALWGAHIFLVSQSYSAAVVDLAAEKATLAPARLAALVEARRSLPLEALLSLQGNAAGRAGPGSAERFVAARDAALAGLAEGERSLAIVAIRATDGNVSWWRGTEVIDPAPEGVDLDAAMQAVAHASALKVGAELYFSAALPLPTEQGEARLLAAVPAAPPSGELAKLAQSLGLVNLGLYAAGQPVTVAGPVRTSLDAIVKSGKSGQPVVTDSGPLGELGPLKLPLFSRTDPVPLELGSRWTFGAASALDAVAVLSTRDQLGNLSKYQTFSLAAAAGLLLLTLIFTVLITPSAPSVAMSVTPRDTREPRDSPRAAVERLRSNLPDLPPLDEPELPSDLFPLPKPPTEISNTQLKAVDDHALGSTVGHDLAQEVTRQHKSQPGLAPVEDLPFRAPPPDDDFGATAIGTAPLPPAASLGDPEDNAPTMAYPRAQPPVTDFGNDDGPVALPGGIPPGAFQESEEITRVAEPRAEPPPQVGAPPVPVGAQGRPPSTQPLAAPVPDADDAHYRSVFQEFQQMRVRCGEAPDNMSYEKFVSKLNKNKDLIIQKHNCRSVRFSVYVKEGKAALKATPVKD